MKPTILSYGLSLLTAAATVFSAVAPAHAQDAPTRLAFSERVAFAEEPQGGGRAREMSFSAGAVPAGGSAQPETAPDEPPEPMPRPKLRDGWSYTLAPYLWASSLRAEVNAGPISSTSEACFSDLLKQLKFGAQLRFEGLHDDRWGFYLDGTYMAMGDDATVRVGRFGLRGIDVEADFTQAYLDFGGTVRFGKQGKSLDLLLGGRYTHLSTDVSVGWLLDIDDSADFVSPMIGGRVQWALSEKWLMSVKGDVGGFGLGDAPDLILGFTGLLGYHLNDHTTLAFGYRFYDFELEGDRYDADVQYHGPIVGVAFRF